jgi:hypothetical protein
MSDELDGGVGDVEWVRYYVTVPNKYVPEWPGGLKRRTKRAGNDALVDEAWTAHRRWEYTPEFAAPRFGGSEAPFPLVEIDEAEADRLRAVMTDRPRGGPFTPQGQSWLADHPDDPAAKYLGVTAPVYDGAGRLVTPMGPVPLARGDESQPEA